MQWKAIPGYEGLYEVSDQGEVRGLRARHGMRAEPRRVKHHDDGKGYRRLTLFKAGAQKAWRVHQLVALAFIGPRPVGQEVRHRDGDRSNNVQENLEYGTSVENRYDAVEHGTHNMVRKTECKRGHEFTEANTKLVTLATGSIARRCRACQREAARLRRQEGQVKS